MNIMNVSRLVNRCADVLFAPMFTRFWQNRLKGKVIVYLYHRIGEHGDHAFLDAGGSPITSMDEFVTDVQFLQSIEANFIRIKDLQMLTLDKDEVYVALTFDDGFSSNYGSVLEWLDTQNIPSTIFQVSSMVDNKQLIWEHQLYFVGTLQKTKQAFWQAIQSIDPDINEGDFSTVRQRISSESILNIVADLEKLHPELPQEMISLADELYPLSDQVLLAQSCGHEIGSHGHNHYFRPCISTQEFEADLKQSNQTLSQIGCQLQSYSFPFNEYQEGDAELAKQYFEFVATVNYGEVTKADQYSFLPRNTWPGNAKNNLRRRRWLLTGRV